MCGYADIVADVSERLQSSNPGDVLSQRPSGVFASRLACVGSKVLGVYVVKYVMSAEPTFVGVGTYPVTEGLGRF